MKRNFLFLVALLCVLCSFAQERKEYTVIGKTSNPVNTHYIWFDKPAQVAWDDLHRQLPNLPYSDPWMEYAIPIGNGRMGACLYGGIKVDEIQFNEKTLWSGTPHDNGRQYGSYLNFGVLTAEMTDTPSEGDTAYEYARGLNFENNAAWVEFKTRDSQTGLTTQHYRNYRAIYSEQTPCIVVRYFSSGKALNLRFRLTPGECLDAKTTYENGEAHFEGQLPTIFYAARCKVVSDKGVVTTDTDGISVCGGESVTVYLYGTTSYDLEAENFSKGNLKDVEKRVKRCIEKRYKYEQKNPYDLNSTDDWKRLYGIATESFSLGDNIQYDIPTDSLIHAYAHCVCGTEPQALALEMLYYHYGRYLACASNHPSDPLPSNLQGIWNHSCTPPWNSDYHANINLQMNYWPVTNSFATEEMNLPLIRYIRRMAYSEQWKQYARDAGQSVGWTTYTENNPYGGVGSFAHNYVVANAWLCTHLWQHYLSHPSSSSLKKSLPAMADACRFWMQRLVFNPADSTYECPMEYSPEQGPQENGVAHAQQLIAELFANTLEAHNRLPRFRKGLSKEELKTLESIYAHLDKGLEIEQYDGKWGDTVNGITTGTPILREWRYSPYYTGENGHRHLSHLMALYPFSQITPSSSYFEAAINSLRLRGDASTGWSMGWKINLWARAHDGDHAHEILKLALRHHSIGGGGVYYNLWDSHAPFQIDGNFGATAGIAEMMVQGYHDTIYLLPAIPTSWKEAGGKSGVIRTRDGILVEIEWGKGGSITRFNITIPSKTDRPITIIGNNIGQHIMDQNKTKQTQNIEIIDENTLRIDGKSKHVTWSVQKE